VLDPISYIHLLVGLLECNFPRVHFSPTISACLNFIFCSFDSATLFPEPPCRFEPSRTLILSLPPHLASGPGASSSVLGPPLTSLFLAWLFLTTIGIAIHSYPSSYALGLPSLLARGNPPLASSHIGATGDKSPLRPIVYSSRLSLPTRLNFAETIDGEMLRVAQLILSHIGGCDERVRAQVVRCSLELRPCPLLNLYGTLAVNRP
jgi:hypothetical protein